MSLQLRKAVVNKNVASINILINHVTTTTTTTTRQYSSDLPEKLNLSAWKRGTGGRSSFNGVVATIFGCTGNVGRILCNRLGRIGTQLILPHRCDFYNCMPLKGVGDLGQVLFQPFDLRDEESLLRVTKYSNIVINLIGREYETKNFTYDDVHVKGARAIARACAQNGVDRLIHLSYLNSAEYPEPIVMKKESGFKKSKWLGEQVVREEFPDATIIKAADIYGGDDRFLRMFADINRHQSHWMPVYKNGEATEKQPVYVGDVAGAIVSAAKDPEARGKLYQALGPRRYLLGELIDYFHRVMWKTKDWGYKRYDMKYDPIFPLRVTLNEKISPAWPFGFLHWEGLEKESTTDVILKDVPTLEDLGITLTNIEDQAPFELYSYKAFLHFKDGMDPFEKIDPPPTIPIPQTH